MNTTTGSSTAERFGRWLGRGWRNYARVERRGAAGLVALGLPKGAAVALMWVGKLAVLALLFYIVFWLALLLLFAVAAAWMARNADWDEPESELRNGHLGFGLYHRDGSRIDPHDPNEEA
ncbi:DUF3742 family protein [Pectobacterium actinidiae]|uniref:DUF3742 family protein n=1 Tax=Pectobacterium actinidiae TaxID=1507808 RepID=UPI0037FFD06C